MIHKTKLTITPSTPVREPKAPPGADLAASRLEDCGYEGYRALHDRVGAPYGWHLRARINDREAMEKLLARAGVEVWGFYNAGALIGYAMLNYADPAAAELEDFGFFPEHTGRGYGDFFLPVVMRRFREAGAGMVWLTTRSTNHPGVADFYQRHGFRVEGVEAVEDDGTI